MVKVVEREGGGVLWREREEEVDLDYAITTTTTTQLFLSLPASLITRCNTVSRHPAASSVSACLGGVVAVASTP